MLDNQNKQEEAIQAFFNERNATEVEESVWEIIIALTVSIDFESYSPVERSIIFNLLHDFITLTRSLQHLFLNCAKT